ncbi:uncharacterized protein MYCFIDRAFT_86794 [Pseudocercospora fijiensis CIRAD86]|uniref:DUF7707 domain-containing protein n=1 Tax=Pseudocercospora fijiensis (strain CIRAD86) TaxID=383855 RepID=M3ART8_PSEFD|nr:uncharacterized protein MYCFIDRAFT_86794 [Pseudocercospora fijiensis CIRAD86]EME80167.1 hypothetical protein MYCFIDRAFT_86794 [Pseudocercospora fijiensis CIRAD86]
MFSSALLLAVTALSAAVSAQNYSTSGPLTINPSQVADSLRQTWCRAQTYNCPILCGGTASPNTCDPNQLTYVCTCSNGNKPNISDYQSTLPFYVCEQWKANCVDSNPNDLDAITGCQSVTCGKQTVKAATASSTSASSSATASSSGTSKPATTATATASSSGAASSATGSSAAVAMHAAQNYGTGIFVTGLLAVFGLAL